MDFLKKHYEKVLLGAVLLGLAAAVAFLFFKVASEKEELLRKETELTKPRVTPLADLDLTPYQAVLQRLERRDDLIAQRFEPMAGAFLARFDLG